MQKQHSYFKLLLLLLATVASYALELHLTVTSDHKIGNVYFLPFFAGMGWLPFGSLTLLGGVLWGMAAAASQLGHDAVHSHSALHLLVETVAIALCLWGCRLRCRLDRSLHLLDTMQRHAPLGIALLDQQGRINQLNPAMLSLLGRSQRDLVGQPWEAFSSHRAEPCELRCQQLRCANGWRHVEVACRALPSEPGGDQKFLVQALDCHQRIESQEGLAREQQRLQQTLRTSLLASALVHEIKQPLAALLLHCRQLLFQHEADPEADVTSTPQQLEILLTSAQELEEAVQAVGVLLRGSGSPPGQPMDLSELVRNCLKAITPQLADLEVNVVQAGLEQPLMLRADPSCLQILVANLLRNAVEALALASNGERHLRVILSRQPAAAELTVSDSGSGLPTTDLRALQLRTSKTTGMGLGLLTAETVATQLGGHLQADRCRQLGGAELRLTLPLDRLQERADSGAAPPDAPAQNR